MPNYVVHPFICLVCHLYIFLDKFLFRSFPHFRNRVVYYFPRATVINTSWVACEKRHLFPHSYGGQSLKSSCQKGWFLLEALRENTFHVFLLPPSSYPAILAVFLGLQMYSFCPHTCLHVAFRSEWFCLCSL